MLFTLQSVKQLLLLFLHPALSCWFSGYRGNAAGYMGAVGVISPSQCEEKCIEMSRCKAVSISYKTCTLYSHTDHFPGYVEDLFALRSCFAAIPHVPLTDDNPEFSLRSRKNEDAKDTGSGILIYKEGTVCSKWGFSFIAANLICKSMGYLGAEGWFRAEDVGYNFYFESITMNGVTCKGEAWSSCSFIKSNNSCSHNDDVVLYCTVIPRSNPLKPFLIALGLIAAAGFLAIPIVRYFLKRRAAHAAQTNQRVRTNTHHQSNSRGRNESSVPERNVDVYDTQETVRTSGSDQSFDMPDIHGESEFSGQNLTPSAPREATQEESAYPPRTQERVEISDQNVSCSLGIDNSAPPPYSTTQTSRFDDQSCPSYDDFMSHSELYKSNFP